MTDERLSYLNMSNPLHAIAVGFGIGLKFRRPGTVASLSMLPFCFIAVLFFPLYVKLILIALLTLLFIVACKSAIEVIGPENKHKIACDEFVGMLTSVSLLDSEQWIGIVLAFFVFRFFDMVHPFPISLVSKKIPSYVGIVLDDIYCGILTAVSVYVLFLIINSQYI